ADGGHLPCRRSQVEGDKRTWWEGGPTPISAAGTAKITEGAHEPPSEGASDRSAPNCFGVSDRRAHPTRNRRGAGARPAAPLPAARRASPRATRASSLRGRTARAAV